MGLKIKSSSIEANGTKFFIDDKELENVRSVRINIHVDEIITAEMEIYPEVEIEKAKIKKIFFMNPMTGNPDRVKKIIFESGYSWEEDAGG